MYQEIKKMLEEGGKCLLIENGKSLGVILTVKAYEELKKKSEKIELEINAEKDQKVNASNPIGEALMKEMDFPDLPDEALAKAGASANIDEINLADAESVTLEDLGLDELPY